MTTRKRINIKDIEKKYGKLNFGQLLEAFRLGEEMSQKAFADLLEISPSSLCDLEKGRKVPSASRASKIAKILRVSEKLFVEVAIQDQLNKEGLERLKVSVA